MIGSDFLSKTNIGLVEYTKAQLGRPYWYGCYGNIATKALYDYKKVQYPQYYTDKDFESQFGQKVHDCVGLIKGYLWSDAPDSVPKYNNKQDLNVNGLFEKCTLNGDISTMPKLPGILVFMDNHVGVYVGDGCVIEARGHKYGVVKTKLSTRGWKMWGKCPWIEYEEVEQEK